MKKLTRKEHGDNLLKLFPAALIKEPVLLVNKLVRIDRKGQRISLAACNGEIEHSFFVQATDELCLKARKLLGSNRVFDNTDPRGFFLKVELDAGEVLFRDFGGVGVIAPQF